MDLQYSGLIGNTEGLALSLHFPKGFKYVQFSSILKAIVFATEKTREKAVNCCEINVVVFLGVLVKAGS